MYNVNSKNLIPLCILQIYERHSDELHPLTQEDIILYLENEYNTTLERKAIGKNVRHLREQLDIDIVYGPNGSWLAGRSFEPYELRLLIDSVMSDRYISRKDSDELTEKLCRLSNKYFRSHLKNVIVMDQANKTDNRDVYYNLEVTDEAIESGLDIRFRYWTLAVDEMVLTPPRVIRPEGIIFMNQRYYVVTRSVPGNELAPVKYYELEKIKSIELVEREQSGENKQCAPLDKEELRKVASDGMTHSLKNTSCRFYAPAGLINDIKAAFGEDNIVLRRCSEKEAKEAAEFFAAEYDVTVNTNIEVLRHYTKMHSRYVKIIRPEKLALWLEMEALRVARVYGAPKSMPALSENDKRVLRELSLETKLELNIPIELGEYQYDTDKAPIEWIPVYRDEGKALLISKYGIDFAPVKTGWLEKWNDKCKFRKWLNGEFRNSFSEDEKSMLEPFENGDTVSVMPMKYLRTSGYVNNCNIIEPTPFARQRWQEHGGSEDSIKHFWGTDYEGEVVGFSEKSPFGMRNCKFSDCLIRPAIWIKTV